ncbi:MAG: hypothetical protein AABY47_10235, partial [Pseudomonadota bacterium]
MGYFLLAALISITSTPVLANDFGVSINIGQPGFYGQINLGSNYPMPQLIYPNPVLVMSPAIAVQQQPIYLYVPPGHAKRWNKYCYRYNACNQPVYFIQREWYNNVYVPHYHSQNNYPGGQQYYDSGRQYYDNDGDHSQRYYDSSRQHSHDNYQDRRNDRDNHGRGNDKHRGKHDQGNHDRREQDRGNR